MYILRCSQGVVAGFNRLHNVVQCTESPTHYKTFKTDAAALKWAEKYFDRGYGFNSYDVHICLFEPRTQEVQS